MEKNEAKEAPCHKCDKLNRYVYKFVPINYVTVCTSEYCNGSCVYCQTHFGKKNVGYNPMPYLMSFHKEGLFSKDCYFDWGGGEPTLNPWFGETVQWLNRCGYRQRINTNAILYSKEAEMALMQGENTYLRMSIDSGSEECFRFMKGHGDYHLVWEHIRDYCRASDKVYVKYNVCNYNSDLAEVEIFVQKCKECGVKHVIIDAEVNSYQPSKNAGPFYYTEKEFEAAHYLEKLAKEEGLDVIISGYAFSVRKEIDDRGNIILPKKYFDNLDHEICSGGILVRTFPSVAYMVEQIKQCKHPVVIWGGGKVGRKCLTVLQANDISVMAIIDKDPQMHGQDIQGVPVRMPKDIFSKIPDAKIFLAGRYWKEMLREINEQQYRNQAVYYMPDCYYED